MLRSILWTILFLIFLAISAFGALFLLASAKEGGERWHLVTAWLTSFGLLFIWWKLSGYFRSRYDKVLSFLGKGILVAVCVFYSIVSLPYTWTYFQGPWYAGKASIENYQDSFIIWPGIAGPVGLHIEMDLVHPFQVRGNLHPPTIWMGLDKEMEVVGAYYAFDTHYFNDGDLWGPSEDTISLLQHALFDHTKSPPVPTLTEGNRTRLVYDLYPRSIAFWEPPSKLCLKLDTFGLSARRTVPPVRTQGKDLSAIWFLAGSANLVVDMSELLTRTIREHGLLQGNAEAWKQIQMRLEPQGLKDAGYRECKILENNLDRSSGRQCYCRGEG